MSKTNFNKVEESLKKGLDDLKIAKIVESTDKKAEDLQNKRLNRKKLSIQLISELKQLHKKDPNIYAKLQTNVAELKNLLENPSKMQEEDWIKVEELKNKIDNYKKAFPTEKEDNGNEDLVEKEREKHINKRFNIQDKWLPID